MAGERLNIEGMGLIQGYTVSPAEAQAWWARAQKGGEEAYLAAHVLPAESDGANPNGEWPNGIVLWVLEARYPRKLGQVYRTVLDERPRVESWPVVEAIARSALPREEKARLFLYGATHKRVGQRRPPLWHLKDVAPARFVALLVEALNAMPRTPPVPYAYCPEASLSYLVSQTDDPKGWDALEEAARRADAGLRLELLLGLDAAHARGKPRQRGVAFLAKFLDDAEVRDVAAEPEKFAGRCAGGDFPRLEVRNFAAVQLASALKIAAAPREDWTPEQWANLRE